MGLCVHPFFPRFSCRRPLSRRITAYGGTGGSVALLTPAPVHQPLGHLTLNPQLQLTPHPVIWPCRADNRTSPAKTENFPLSRPQNGDTEERRLAHGKSTSHLPQSCRGARSETIKTDATISPAAVHSTTPSCQPTDNAVIFGLSSIHQAADAAGRRSEQWRIAL